MNRHLMETQNLVISFDYSWFLAKNLAYAECPIMKFQYWNSSTKNQRYLLLDATRSSYFFWKVSENLSLFLTSGPQEAIMETSCLVFWTCLYVFISKYGICIPFDLESWQWNVWISPYMSVTWPSLVGIGLKLSFTPVYSAYGVLRFWKVQYEYTVLLHYLLKSEMVKIYRPNNSFWFVNEN